MFYSGNIVRIKRSGDMFNELAIVDGSYAIIHHSMCGELDDRHYHQYSLLHFNGNTTAWYLEDELELISNGSVKLVTAWCKRYKSGYDTVDKMMISKGDIIQNKHTGEYSLVISVHEDKVIVISISNFNMNSRRYSPIGHKYDVIQDMYDYKYIMSIDIPEESIYDVLSITINNDSWDI